MNWVLANLGLIAELALQHLRQSIVPIILGLVVSVPLGWLAWRYRPVRGVLLGATGLLYTIPSLALLMILPTVLGISPLSEINLVLALTIYAVAIMVRAVVDGFDAVDPAVRGSATAIGFSGSQRFWRVELPLAGPVILAGLRVTAVSTVALATVGILIGVSNLGYLFTNGLERRIVAEVLAGVVSVVVIALIVDLLLVLLGRALMPWGRPAGRRSAQRARARASVEVTA